MRIQYRHPKLYSFLISFLYSKKLLRKFEDAVGENNTVFDVAAGYGRMSHYIHSSNVYHGIDVNKKFIEHGRQKGKSLALCDIFDVAGYRESDVFLIVDIIHHLAEEQISRLLDIVFSHTLKKVVLIEPAFLDITHRFSFIGNFLSWLFRKIDNDGFNTITRWFSTKEYEELFNNRFGSVHGMQFALSYNRIDSHFFVVFTRQ